MLEGGWGWVGSYLYLKAKPYTSAVWLYTGITEKL